MNQQKYASYILLGFAVMQSLGFLSTAYPFLRAGAIAVIGLAVVLIFCYGLLRWQQAAQSEYYDGWVISFIPSIVLFTLLISAVAAGAISAL